MASTSTGVIKEQSESPAVPNPADAVRTITWGTELKEDVFARWSQGVKLNSEKLIYTVWGPVLGRDQLLGTFTVFH